MDGTTWLLVAVLILVLLSLFTRGTSEPSRLLLVERKLNLILTQLGIDPDEGLDEQIKELVQSGKKIEAIKLYRQHSGVGLKEAKDHIEARYGA